MKTPTHSIVINLDGSYSVALMTGATGEDVNTTWGTFSTYLDACHSAHRDAEERSGADAVFGININKRAVALQRLLEETGS